MFHSASILAAGIMLAIGASQTPAQAVPLPAGVKAAIVAASAEDSMQQAGMGPCHWTKVCVKKSKGGHGSYEGYYHCLKWEHKKVCNPGSEKPQQNRSRVHVPPFERQLHPLGPSFSRQGPAFNQGTPPFGRGMQIPGSGMSSGRRR